MFLSSLQLYYERSLGSYERKVTEKNPGLNGNRTHDHDGQICLSLRLLLKWQLMKYFLPIKKLYDLTAVLLKSIERERYSQKFRFIFLKSWMEPFFPGYCPSSFLRVNGPRRSRRTCKNIMTPISSHLERTSLGYRGFMVYRGMKRAITTGQNGRRV